jgi:hypothetical protein
VAETGLLGVFSVMLRFVTLIEPGSGQALSEQGGENLLHAFCRCALHAGSVKVHSSSVPIVFCVMLKIRFDPFDPTYAKFERSYIVLDVLTKP